MPHATTAAPATPTAAPCVRCGGTGGRTQHGRPTPCRPRGFCLSCYGLLWNRCDRHGYGTFEEAEAHVPRVGGLPRAYTRRAQERVQARQRAIRDHLGAHITAVTPTGLRPLPWPAAWGTPATDPLARAAWADAEQRAA